MLSRCKGETRGKGECECECLSCESYGVGSLVVCNGTEWKSRRSTHREPNVCPSRFMIVCVNGMPSRGAVGGGWKESSTFLPWLLPATKGTRTVPCCWVSTSISAQWSP